MDNTAIDIHFNCPSCNQSIAPPPDLAGQLIGCPSCKNIIGVPILRKAPKVQRINVMSPPSVVSPARGIETTPEIEAKTVHKQNAPNPHAGSTKNMQMIGLVGSALLFVGPFCPIVTVPIMGSMNYFQNGQGDGTIIIVLAVVSAFLIYGQRFRFLWLTGGLALNLVAFTYIRFQYKLSELKSNMESELEGNPFAGLAQMAVQSVQLQWGFAILVLGAILVMAAAAMSGGRNIR